jgi:hypothetical protein
MSLRQFINGYSEIHFEGVFVSPRVVHYFSNSCHLNSILSKFSMIRIFEYLEMSRRGKPVQILIKEL